MGVPLIYAMQSLRPSCFSVADVSGRAFGGLLLSVLQNATAGSPVGFHCQCQCGGRPGPPDLPRIKGWLLGPQAVCQGHQALAREPRQAFRRRGSHCLYHRYSAVTMAVAHLYRLNPLAGQLDFFSSSYPYLTNRTSMCSRRPPLHDGTFTFS